jgi:23S rRNA (guanosine2251-2'-O)-methyltransferase
VLTKTSRDLSLLFPDLSHQGIVGVAEEFVYTDLEQLVQSRPQNQGLLIALDHITDEGNLGAIIRTCVFFGAQGLILPKDRSAGMTAGALKRSSGLYIHLPISRVVNLARSLELLKKEGFWIIGAAGESQCTVYDFDWNREVVLVLGNEERGLSESVKKVCDQVVGIPACGRAESLNVAVAGGVILSEIVRQRKARNGPHGQ